jgi:hypothetical protein
VTIAMHMIDDIRLGKSRLCSDAVFMFERYLLLVDDADATVPTGANAG